MRVEQQQLATQPPFGPKSIVPCLRIGPAPAILMRMKRMCSVRPSIWAIILLPLLLMVGCDREATTAAPPTASPGPSTLAQTTVVPPSGSATPTPSPVPATPATAIPSPSPTVARVAIQPRFEANACPFKPAAGQVEGSTLRCGTLTVPEDRFGTGSGLVRLAVAIFRANDPAAAGPPLVWLDGGPGGPSLIGLGEALTLDLSRELTDGRDLILFDQRGVGFSRPSLSCEELIALKYDVLDKRLQRDEQRRRYMTAALACRDRLRSAGVNLAAYTSATSAADVNDLRIALGHQQIKLYGVSYGTRLALTVIRDFPSIVAQVVLDSTLPLEADLYRDVYANAQRSLDLLFASCARSPSCPAGAGLSGIFYDTVQRWNANPVLATFRNPKDQREQPVLLTGDSLVSIVFQLLYRTSVIPTLPAMIRSAAGDDLAPLVRAYSDLLYYDELSRGMYLSVQCAEEAPFVSRAELSSAAAAVNPLVAAAFGDGEEDALFDICTQWGVRPPLPQENQSVHAAVPALVLAGEFDPVTPPSWGAAVAAALTNATIVQFPATGHGVFLSNRCPFAMALAFLRSPSSVIDRRCADQIGPPRWQN